MCDSNSCKIDTQRKGYGLASIVVVTGLLLFGVSCSKSTAKTENIVKSTSTLPPPAISASPFLQIVQKRHTSEVYASRKLDRQIVSNLLWAAFGINRPKDGRRTAPSAHNWQYIDVFVSDSEGLYRFNAEKQSLDLMKTGDIRAMTGIQSYAAKAPIDLVYVSDESKMGDGLSADVKMLYAAATAGAIAQNVYLFCAATDLDTGVRADIDRDALHKVMGLSTTQKIILAQSVGYPSALANLTNGIKHMFSI